MNLETQIQRKETDISGFTPCEARSLTVENAGNLESGFPHTRVGEGSNPSPHFTHHCFEEVSPDAWVLMEKRELYPEMVAALSWLSRHAVGTTVRFRTSHNPKSVIVAARNLAVLRGVLIRTHVDEDDWIYLHLMDSKPKFEVCKPWAGLRKTLERIERDARRKAQ